MNEHTQFLMDHVVTEMKPWNQIKNNADEEDIAKIIEEAMAEKEGFDYVRCQRPDGDVYRELLAVDAGQQRDGYITTRRGNREVSQLAEGDIQRLMGNRAAGRSEGFPFQYKGDGLRAMKQRQKDLSLCLSISPALTCDEINTVLWKFFGESPLHLRNPIDVIYTFVFLSRDAQAEGFKTLDEQQKIIRKLMTFADKERRWGIRKKKNAAGALPATRMIEEGLAALPVGNLEEFIDWFDEAIDSMDVRDRRYSVRQHFARNLLAIAQARTAAENAALVGRRYEQWYQSGDDEERKKFREFSIGKFTEFFYRNRNKLQNGDGRWVNFTSEELNEIITHEIDGGEKPDFRKTQREIESEDRHIAPEAAAEQTETATEQARRENETREISLLKGMEIATWSIGLQFYLLWHEIGVQFASDYKDGLPENFPEREKWQKYVNCLNEKGESLQEIAAEYMKNEPDFLRALRDYALQFPQEDQKLKKDIDLVQAAQQQFAKLMEDDSILYYIMSDWHYACVSDKSKKEDHIGENADDDKSLRIRRLTSHSQKIARPDDSEVIDTPKSLFILSELAAQNAAAVDKMKAAELIDHINTQLAKYGYPLMDIRKRFDYMVYCAIQMAAAAQSTPTIRFDEIFDGLHRAIENYSFGDSLLILERTKQRDEAQMNAVISEKFGMEIERGRSDWEKA